MKQKINYFISAVLAMVVIFGFVVLSNKPDQALGSVASSEGYYATSTDSTWGSTYALGGKVLRVGDGMLGSVVVTSATAGTLIIYDASTTVNGAVYATTTLATFPASTAAGTYTFDVTFHRGLLVTYAANGGAATSTITFK